MIPPWLALLLVCLGILILMVGIYLLGRHHGYWAGRAARIDEIPGDPWRRPPSEGEFTEMLARERRGEPPRKYQREK